MQAGNDAATKTTFFAEFAYVVAMIMYFMKASITNITITFGSIMLVSLIVEGVLIFLKKKYSSNIV